MFFPAEADAEDDDDKAEQEYGEIAIFPIQLRHIFEIHAVPACNERQGEKDGGDDGEDFHDFVLPDVDLGLVNLPDLRGILPEHERFLMQPSHTFAEKAEGIQFAAVKEAVIILLQYVADVGKLQIIVGIDEDFSAAAHDFVIEIIKSAGQDFILQMGNLVLNIGQAEQIF